MKSTEKETFLRNRLWNLTGQVEYDHTNRYRSRLDHLDTLMLRYARGSVLEVGCGAGRFLEKLRATERTDRITGIDIRGDRIREAREKGFHAVRADGVALPFEDSRFDVLLIADGTPELAISSRLLREASRVLKPGGHFVFDTYNRFPLEKRLKHTLLRLVGIADGSYGGIDGGVKNTKTLRAGCREAGFRVATLYTLCPIPLHPFGLLLEGERLSGLHTHLIAVLQKKTTPEPR